MTTRQVHGQDYQRTITAAASPAALLDRISRVSDWWGTGVTGRSQAAGDVFTIRFGDTFIDFRVAEVVPNEKVVWNVTDCHLAWLNHKTEWQGTAIVWEVTPERPGGTRVRMTHVGLVPGIECFEDCERGWDFYVGESLLKLVTEGRGLPNGQRRSAAGRSNTPAGR